MRDQHRSPSSNTRDQNLSNILETITDDGPAKPQTEGQNPAGERRHNSLVEEAYGPSSTAPDREKATGPTKEAYGPPSTVLGRETVLDRGKATGPAKTPRERTPKRRSWRQELTIAGFTGIAALIALVVLYAPWRTEPAQSSTEARKTNEAVTDFETIQTSVTSLSERMEGLGTESNRTLEQLDRRLSKAQETTQQQLSTLERRFERIGRLEHELALLASRLEALENEAHWPLLDDGARGSGKDGAEAGVPDARHAESERMMTASTIKALPLKSDSGSQDSWAGFPESGAYGPGGEPAVEEPDLDATEPPQIPVSVSLKPESDVIQTRGSNSANRAGGDLSNRQVAPAILPPAKSDGHKAMEDSVVLRSETLKADERGSNKQWAINLIALGSKTKAQELQSDYAAKGVDVELIQIRTSRSRGKLFGLRVPGFASREEAVAYAGGVKQKLGIREVWIYEY